MLRPKPNLPNVLPSKTGNVPLAGQGENIPVLFGTGWFKQPNVVYFDNVHPEPIIQEVKQGSS